jgi:hypothetical protein
MFSFVTMDRYDRERWIHAQTLTHLKFRQGDVRAAELMWDRYPYEFEGAYVHLVIERPKTYGYAPERWLQNEFSPFFFRTYPEAALHAATRDPPLIRIQGLRRICVDAVKDFLQIKASQFASHRAREERRLELNQAIWRANKFILSHSEDPVDLVPAVQRWQEGEMVSTTYGAAQVVAFDSTYNLYKVLLDWRPLSDQVRDYEAHKAAPRNRQRPQVQQSNQQLETVDEIDDEKDDDVVDRSEHLSLHELDLSTSPAIDSGPNTTASQLRSSSLTQAVGESSSESADSNRRRVSEAPVSRPDQAPFERPRVTKPGFVFATIAGSSMKSLTPPALPSLPALSKTKGSSLFQSFMSKDTKAVATKASWSKGESVSTPYGPAIVVEHRESQSIIVAKFLRWNARAFLHESSVKRHSGNVISTFLRQLSGVDGAPKVADAKLPVGTIIDTPFGQSKVERPVKAASLTSSETTVGLRLTSWKLADGSGPTIYCTVATAQAWKDKKSSTLLSTLNTIVSSYGNTLLEPFLVQRKAATGPASGTGPTSVTVPTRRFEQYFKNSACVRSKYGVGRIQAFRENDGIYVVELSSWKLAHGSKTMFYSRQDDLSCYSVDGCREGFPVLTAFGLTGTLASIDPKSGIHTVQAKGMVCFLQPEAVIKPLLACVGEDVITPYGDGVVVSYVDQSGVYVVRLAWGALLYTTHLDRAGDGTQIREGSFGIEWLFNLFSRKETAPGSRSRSNSVVSSRSGQPL